MFELQAAFAGAGGDDASDSRDIPAQESALSLVNVNPPSVYDASGNGMSQARADTDTGLVFVSGQVDWATDFSTEGTDVGTQAENAMVHLGGVLEAAGSSFAQVLQLRIYVRGEAADHMAALMPVVVRHFGDVRPALTGVGVASLDAPELLVEIEAVAKVAARG